MSARRGVLRFLRCELHSVGLGVQEEHVIGVVHLELEVDGSSTPFTTTIKQTAGGTSHDGPYEISLPIAYRGVIKYDEFRAAVERYYRHLVGRQGTGVSVDDSSVFLGARVIIESKAESPITLEDEGGRPAW